VEAIAGFRSGTAGEADDVEAFRASRLIIPLLA
jgi:hypothetical protein